MSDTKDEELGEADEETNSEIKPEGEITRGHALADARGILSQELSADTELTTKAWRSVQFSGLCATIFTGLVVPHLTISHFDLLSTLALLVAGLLLAISITIGVQQQDSIEITAGPETKYYRAIADFDYNPDEYMKKSLKLHANAIDDINEEIEKKARKVKITLFTSITGVVFLSIATVLLFV